MKIKELMNTLRSLPEFAAMKDVVQCELSRSAYEEIPVMTDFSWVKDNAEAERRMARYKECRRRFDRFMSDYVRKRLTREVLAKSAARIGLDMRNASSFTQGEQFALADFAAICNDIDDGIPLIRRGYMKALGSDDPDIVAACKMVDAYHYTWSKILNMKSGVGMKCLDLLTNREFFLMEGNLSRSHQVKGMVLFAGLVPVDDCFMTTGCGFPVPIPASETERMLSDMLEDLRIHKRPPMFLNYEEQAMFAAVSVKLAITANPVEMRFA